MEKKLEVEIQVIIHATEDSEKIFDSFKEMFFLEKADFAVQSLQGHYENPISLVNAKIKKKKAGGFVKNLIANIPKKEIDEIIEDLENRCDGSGLFLRISKQSLVEGKIEPAGDDPIKIRIYTPIYSQKEIIRTYSQLLTSTI
ncbi:MAG TPA: exosome protein [Candidatus Nitrosotenuis sp.]|jgi:RNA binding exosome subunit|nr:exosome protein [Candidatus Nitrosotenuis sp.]HIH45838.1 exosome protein [Candidatus Nitrosotenuis sp.]HIH68962.1 exosome protein [Candidatus Nitrosotenuis sp.]HII03490.1 exosome protein [Candidatus Nitrosotenuis sp.]